MMAAGVLDYSGIFQEVRGALHEGRLRLNPNNVVFKNIKTGKVETIPISDIDSAVWRRVARGYELKLALSNGRSLKFDGFRDSEFEKFNKHVKSNYNITLEQQDMSSKGWNWGDATFNGYEVQFDIDGQRAFEIPLQNVSQCTPGKNEVSLEFHQNDDAELSLMEMRFFVPPSQNDETDTVQVFSDNVISKADVLQAKGNAICTFQDIQCLTPKGHYDIRMYPKFVQLHGKTFDYKITYTSILRLFLLPHRDQRQIFFVVSLDPPLSQGQTRYHFLVLLFYKKDEMSVEMTLSEEEIEEKFGSSLQKDMSGPIYDVVSKVMKNLVQRKITVPGSFRGPGSEQCIMCTYRASSGFLFPLERGFMYVHKPPIHVRFDEIAYVNFAHSTVASRRSFDFEIETRSQATYVFSNIEKDCYPALFDFVRQKKLKIKNIEKGVEGGANIDSMANSDSEDEQHDAYIERMKQEATDRDEQDVGSDDDSSDDEDFNPGEDTSMEVERENDAYMEKMKQKATDRDEQDVDSGDDSSDDEDFNPGSDTSMEVERENDAYMEKMKQKAADRDEQDVESGDDSSDDEDFNPGADTPMEVRDEFDSDAGNTGTEEGSGGGDPGSGSDKEKKKKTKEKRHRKKREEEGSVGGDPGSDKEKKKKTKKRYRKKREEEGSGGGDPGSGSDKEKKKTKEKRYRKKREEEGSGGGDPGSGSDEEKKKKTKEKRHRKKREEGDGRKKWKHKDPNAPKRPTTSYMLWRSDNRSKIKKDNPDLSMTEITNEVGRLWKEVTEEEKQAYTKRFEKEKVRYAEEMKKYAASGGSKFSSPKSQVRDEIDSDAGNTSTEEGSGAGDPGSGSDEEKKKKPKEKRHRKKREEGDGRKKRKHKDPKRPTTSYMLWRSDNRSKIKKDNPDLSMTEITKEVGRLWKEVTEEEKQAYTKKFEKGKVRYAEKMKKYAASSWSKFSSPKRRSVSSTSKTKSSSKGSLLKSKEFIQDSWSSSSDSDPDSPPEAKSPPKAKGKRKFPSPKGSDKSSVSEASAAESEEAAKPSESEVSAAGSEEEAESTPASGEDSD